MAPAEAVQVRLICDDETAVAVRLIGAAGATVIPDWVAVMPEVVSVTVTDCVPAVSNVTEKVCTPLFGGGEGVVRRQGGRGVAAGELDRAGVTGRHVAVGILRGDREGLRHARGRGRGKAGEDELAGGGRADADPGERAGDGGRRRIRRGDRLAAGGLERDRERVRSVVGRGEGKVRRQAGLDVGAGELDRAQIAGVRRPARRSRR